jgi:hypothetical protein
LTWKLDEVTFVITKEEGIVGGLVIDIGLEKVEPDIFTAFTTITSGMSSGIPVKTAYLFATPRLIEGIIENPLSVYL